MICFVCKHGETKNSTATVTLERDGTTLVIKDVPARVCANCGETYFEADVTDALLAMLDVAVEAGVQVEIRAYSLPLAS